MENNVSFWFVHVHVGTQVCRGVPAYVACARGGQRLASGIIPQVPPTLTFETRSLIGLELVKI